MSKVYILEIIRAKFHQNRFSRLGCSADTDRQTDRHTHTDRQTDNVVFSDPNDDNIFIQQNKNKVTS